MLALNPPFNRVCTALMFLPGSAGVGNATSKTNLKDIFNSRVTFNVITGSLVMFFNTISTFGPPGFTGGKGPVKETTSIGCRLVALGVVVVAVLDWEVVVVEDAQDVKSVINVIIAHNNRTILTGYFCRGAFILIFSVFISVFPSRSIDKSKYYGKYYIARPKAASQPHGTFRCCIYYRNKYQDVCFS